MFSALCENFRFLKFRRACRRQMEIFHRMDDPWRAQVIVPRLEPIITSHIGTVRFEHALELGGGQGILTPIFLKFCKRLDFVEISKRGIARAKIRLKEYEPRVAFFRRDLHSFFAGPQFDLMIFSFILDYLGYRQFPRQFTATLNALLAQGRDGATILIINPVYNDEDRLRMEEFEILFKKLGCRKKWQEAFGNDKDGVVVMGFGK